LRALAFDHAQTAFAQAEIGGCASQIRTFDNHGSLWKKRKNIVNLCPKKLKMTKFRKLLLPLSMEGKAPALKINKAETNTRVKGNAICLFPMCIL
jgi:hypothetical protein